MLFLRGIKTKEELWKNVSVRQISKRNLGKSRTMSRIVFGRNMLWIK